MKLHSPLLASIDSDFQAAVVLAASSRNYSPSRAPIASPVHIARFPWTSGAGHSNGDLVTLGSLGLAGARVIPALSRIVGTGTVTAAVKMTLQKTNAAGASAVALSAQTAQITDPLTVTTLAPVAAAPDSTVLAADDLLKVVLNFGTGSTLTLAATNTFVAEIAYTVE
ncbi:hypothetical protein UFOVP813_28 [uncultured Caudovirales phage]|uniref:Uncharacterized protein n=1 Tax=uncultured Caudovirales phage TaxID=2100421 RepID=A0A6J5P2F0_9CAUD|nr:hypothetical protein UFOVP813_28 [uncultured Caudovirales phage]